MLLYDFPYSRVQEQLLLLFVTLILELIEADTLVRKKEMSM